MILKKFNVERIAESPEQIAALKAEGFVPISGKEPEKEGPKDLEALKKDELVRIAQNQGIDGAKSLNKTELLEILKGGDNNGPDRSAEGADS